MSKWLASSSKPHWHTTKLAPVALTCARDEGARDEGAGWGLGSGGEGWVGVGEWGREGCRAQVLALSLRVFSYDGGRSDPAYLLDHVLKGLALVLLQLAVLSSAGDVQLVLGLGLGRLKRARENAGRWTCIDREWGRDGGQSNWGHNAGPQRL